MRALLYGLIACLPLLAQAQPTEVRLASEHWPEHAEANGTGLAWDILRAVYEPAGVRLVMTSVPYTRSIGLTQSGKVHGWVGAYRGEVEGMHYPRWHYDTDKVYALGLIGAPEVPLESLGDYRLAWMRGYAFEREFPQVRRYREVDSRAGVPGMLRLGHIDYFIDALNELQLVFDESGADPVEFKASPLGQIPLYIGFGTSPEAKALAELFDARMDVLIRNGSLRPLFERWGQPYPF